MRFSWLVLLSAVLSVPLVFAESEPWTKIDEQQLKIDWPTIKQAPAWQPDTVVVFGDSLSDSNGDDFRSPENALSTYNLLRTLKGYPKSADVEEPPIDLSQFFTRASSVRNIRATFDLYYHELKMEQRERGFLGRIMTGLEMIVVDKLESVITSLVQEVDVYENVIDSVLSSLINKAENIIAVLKTAAGTFHMYAAETALNDLNKKLRALDVIVNTENLADMTEDALIAATSEFADKIPLVPNDHYYETGRWTTGKDMDMMWPQVLVRMMSAPGKTKVRLNNRAMAGSWILCAEDKLGEPGALFKSADGVLNAAVMLFGGSLIPPCEGLVVNSYLDERRAKAQKAGYPMRLFDPETMVVFFNGGNDFLNNWNEPDSIAQEHAQNIWSVLNAGAERVVVIILPDISETPRFRHSGIKGELSKKFREYNTSLKMRLNLLREEFPQANTYRLMTIDAEELLYSLRHDASWDLDNPILDIPVPGMNSSIKNVQAIENERAHVLIQKRNEAEEQNNFVNKELLSNAAFDDNWQTVKGKFNKATAGKTAFYADSVHPSGEAHYKIAEHICMKFSKMFNIPCNPENYTKETAIAEAKARKDSEREAL